MRKRDGTNGKGGEWKGRNVLVGGETCVKIRREGREKAMKIGDLTLK